MQALRRESHALQTVLDQSPDSLRHVENADLDGLHIHETGAVQGDFSYSPPKPQRRPRPPIRPDRQRDALTVEDVRGMSRRRTWTRFQLGYRPNGDNGDKADFRPKR